VHGAQIIGNGDGETTWRYCRRTEGLLEPALAVGQDVLFPGEWIMSEFIELDVEGNDQHFVIPNTCPLCHRDVNITAHKYVKWTDDWAEIVYDCPNRRCGRLFIAHYRLFSGIGPQLEWLQPIEISIRGISEVIRKISSDFAETYTQSERARQSGLSQICGPGFRKAFEFLIKDYAKHVATQDEEKKKIEKSFSGDVVENYIGDVRVKEMAKRALWLGNDESHYLRKWKDHDVADLIMLIQLTIYWIQMEQLSSDYRQTMAEGKDVGPHGE